MRLPSIIESIESERILHSDVNLCDVAKLNKNPMRSGTNRTPL